MQWITRNNIGFNMRMSETVNFNSLVKVQGID